MSLKYRYQRINKITSAWKLKKLHPLITTYKISDSILRNFKINIKLYISKALNIKFNDIFIGNLDRVPMKVEMEDIWFISDYKINYERLTSITEPKQLNKLNTFLKYVGDRISQKNPLINHFRSIIAEKFKKNDEANLLKELSKNSLANSEYWKKRFVSLNIH